MQTSLYLSRFIWDAAIIHAVDMPQPAQSALPEQSVRTGKASTRQYIDVGHSVCPEYAQDTANTSQVEGVASSLLFGLRSPCLTAILQGADDTGVVDCHLFFHYQFGVYIHTRVVRQARGVAAFPTLLSISVSNERLSVMVELRYVK